MASTASSSKTATKEIDQWSATAAKLSAEEALTSKTQKELFEDSLQALKSKVEKLDETRWLYEEMPTRPDRLEKCAGL